MLKEEVKHAPTSDTKGTWVFTAQSASPAMEKIYVRKAHMEAPPDKGVLVLFTVEEWAALKPPKG